MVDSSELGWYIIKVNTFCKPSRKDTFVVENSRYTFDVGIPDNTVAALETRLLQMLNLDGSKYSVWFYREPVNSYRLDTEDEVEDGEMLDALVTET